MILSDREIEAAHDHHLIMIDPRPGPELWTSTAIDLTLDSVLLRWKEPRRKATGEPVKPHEIYPAREGFDIQAMTLDPDLAERLPIPAEGYPLGPGQFVLGFTSQRIYCTRSRVEGDRRTDGTRPTESCLRLTGRGGRATIL